MSDRIMNSRKTRRRLAPSEKYEMFVSVLTGQATQREAAAKWGVPRPGRRAPGPPRPRWQAKPGACPAARPPGQAAERLEQSAHLVDGDRGDHRTT
jgi:hypothetical protein